MNRTAKVVGSRGSSIRSGVIDFHSHPITTSSQGPFSWHLRMPDRRGFFAGPKSSQRLGRPVHGAASRGLGEYRFTFVAMAQTAEGCGVSSLARTHTQAQSAEARCKLTL